jgi:hypothetical protein
MGYKIPFKSFKDTSYVLEIGSGTLTTLTGGVDTFVTEEDADTDFFKPVRTQSGTFRYTGSGSGDRSVWLAMIPTNALSIPVKLKVGSTVKWQGYIQPEVYHNDFPANGSVMEHEFSVQCPLSVLDTVDCTTTIDNNNVVVTIGKLLKDYIFKVVTDNGITISKVFMQGQSTATRARLNILLMWANFIDTVEDGITVHTVAKYTYGQLLEEVCKFFGYTCRMVGENVYFTMPVRKGSDAKVGFTEYTLEQIATANASGTYHSPETFNINNGMFCDTNNHEQILPGYKKVTVRSDINEISNLIELPYDELFDRYNIGQYDSICQSVDWYSRAIYANRTPQPNADNSTLTYENDEVSLSCYMESAPSARDGGGYKRYCRFIAYDDGDAVDPGAAPPQSKLHFSWKKSVELFRSADYTGSASAALFTITSKQMMVLTDGILYIDFKCDHVSAWLVGTAQVSGTTIDFPLAVCRLRIGDRYWNGSAWSSNSNSSFYLSFTADGAKTNRPDYKSQYGGDILKVPQYDGYGARVTGTMRGIVEFQVLDVPKWQTYDTSVTPIELADINGFLPMMDFEIGFVRGVIEDTKHRGNEYVVNGGSFSQEYNVDLIFASDVVYGPANYQRHMPAGLGYILGIDSSNYQKPIQNIKDLQNRNVIAEEELATVIATYGNKTHRLIQMDVWTNMVGDVVPSKLTNTADVLSDMAGMFPLAIGHNWREDITTLTLIKVNSND